MPLFFAGNGESANTIICALEIPNNDWFKRALIEALTLMCDEYQWGERGTATVEFARDKSCEMNETLQMDVIIPTLPIGTIGQWAIATPPTKWLICNGQSVLRASYSALFAVLGTAYGAADSTHFYLPDYRDYSPMGVGSTLAIGGAAGAFLHAISPGEMPSHTHAIIDPGHVHGERLGVADLPAFKGAGTGGFAISGATSGTANRINTDSNTTQIGIGNTGGGSLLNLLHPVRGVHFIIYAGI